MKWLIWLKWHDHFFFFTILMYIVRHLMQRMNRNTGKYHCWPVPTKLHHGIFDSRIYMLLYIESLSDGTCTGMRCHRQTESLMFGIWVLFSMSQICHQVDGIRIYQRLLEHSRVLERLHGSKRLLPFRHQWHYILLTYTSQMSGGWSKHSVGDHLKSSFELKMIEVYLNVYGSQ